MLKELNKRWQHARSRAAAWRRWNRKLPHNRVWRPIVRDMHGHRVGRGLPIPIPEPKLDSRFCRIVQFPSGRREVTLSGSEIETAYLQARYPKATASEVMPLPFKEDDIRRMIAENNQQ